MLSQINSPADLAALSHAELIELSGEIRALLIEKVSKTGGHLGPNLGVVEWSSTLKAEMQFPSDENADRKQPR